MMLARREYFNMVTSSALSSIIALFLGTGLLLKSVRRIAGWKSDFQFSWFHNASLDFAIVSGCLGLAYAAWIYRRSRRWVRSLGKAVSPARWAGKRLKDETPEHLQPRWAKVLVAAMGATMIVTFSVAAYERYLRADMFGLIFLALAFLMVWLFMVQLPRNRRRLEASESGGG